MYLRNVYLQLNFLLFIILTDKVTRTINYIVSIVECGKELVIETLQNMTAAFPQLATVLESGMYLVK